MGRFASAVAVLSTLASLSGCKAQVNARANVSAKAGQEGSDLDEPVDPEALERSAEEPVLPAREPALLGARADLRLKGRPGEPKCQCLAVHVGAPSDAAFEWQVGAPEIDPQTQLAIAFTSEGTNCADEPKESLGASYWGYKVQGVDVVVVVEAARFGRPITTGAIIPRPGASGRVLIEPVDPKLPYGRPPDPASRCVTFEDGGALVAPQNPSSGS